MNLIIPLNFPVDNATHFPVVSSSFKRHRQDLYGTLEVLGGHVGEAIDCVARHSDCVGHDEW
jgi:hypothetical protein